MIKRLRDFLNCRSGATPIDYSVVTAMVSVACIAVLIEGLVG